MSKKTLPLVPAVCLLASLALFFASPGAALPPNEVETWYLDSSGNIVGYRYLGCDGYRLFEGVMTSNTLVYAASCNTGYEDIGCHWAGSSWSCAANMFYELCTLHYSPSLCAVP